MAMPLRFRHWVRMQKTATEKSSRRTLKNQIIIRFMPNLGIPKFSKKGRRIPVAVR
jgi:hypothetical protein